MGPGRLHTDIDPEEGDRAASRSLSHPASLKESKSAPKSAASTEHSREFRSTTMFPKMYTNSLFTDDIVLLHSVFRKRLVFTESPNSRAKINKTFPLVVKNKIQNLA